jgi:hypothetical protein
MYTVLPNFHIVTAAGLASVSKARAKGGRPGLKKSKPARPYPFRTLSPSEGIDICAYEHAVDHDDELAPVSTITMCKLKADIPSLSSTN